MTAPHANTARREGSASSPGGARSLLHAAGSISGLTLLSRILGLVRDMLTVHVLGAAWTGTFVLAWLTPNMFRRLFGEGALSAAFVPAYTRALEHEGKPPARALLGGVTGALIVALGVLTAIVLLGVALAPTEWLDREPGHGSTLRLLLLILFPYTIPICLVAIYTGALQSLGSFVPGAAAPVVLNLFWIVGIAAAVVLGIQSDAEICLVVAVFLIAASVAQLVVVMRPLARRGYLASPARPHASDGTRDVFRKLAPTMLGLSLVQLNLLFDQGLAYFLIGEGQNTHVYLANRLLSFPHAMTALPLATAVFPTLATHASREDLSALRTSLGHATTATLFLAIPATLGLIVVQQPLIEIVFVGGKFTASDAIETGWTTIALVIGLPALAVSQLDARALYALGDTRTPARVAAWLVLLNLCLNLTFVLVFRLGVAGLTLATSCCAYVNAFALHTSLALRHDGAARLPGRSIARALAASGFMMLAASLVRDAFSPEGVWAKAVFRLGLPVVCGMAAYTLAQLVLRSPELAEIRRRLRRFAQRTKPGP